MIKFFSTLIFFSIALFPNFAKLQSEFLNFSDVHFDPFYDTTLVNKLIQNEYTEWENIFLRSEINTPSSYGDDSNFPLMISALNEMSQRIPNPSFIIITGDFMSHNFNENFEKYSGSNNEDLLHGFITKTIKFITSQIVKYFPLSTILPSVGNDDAFCGNYMIDPGGPFLKMLGETWEALVNRSGVNPDFNRDFSNAGYCVVNLPYLQDKKLIILNTVYFSTKYKNHCGDMSLDPGTEELNWLSRTLQQCKINNEKVWMTYHIPPGIDIYGTITDTGSCEERAFPSWDMKYNSEFVKIINEYSSIINSGFAGHFHRDDFRIFLFNKIPLSYIHITPSISPIYGNNPAYQIFEYDPDIFELLNYRTYYLNNLSKPDSAYWTFEYDFQKAYGQSTITSQTLNNVARSIAADTVYRERYIRYYTSNSVKAFPKDYSNWLFNWCGFANLDINDYSNCLCDHPERSGF